MFGRSAAKYTMWSRNQSAIPSRAPLTGERVAGWQEYWLADGSGLNKKRSKAPNDEHQKRISTRSGGGSAATRRRRCFCAPRAACRELALSRLAFVKRHRHGLLMLEAAPARAHAALHHHVAHRVRAHTAAGGDAELELQLVERVDAFRDRGTDLSVRNRLADTDNHGGRHS